jgi:hypothetical protein
MKSFPTVLGILPLAALLACAPAAPPPVTAPAPTPAPTPSASAPTSPPVSLLKAGRPTPAPANPAPADAALPKKELTIRPDEVEEVSAEVIVRPDGAVQRAHYEVFHFAAADFHTNIGTLTKAATVTVAVDRVEEKTAAVAPGLPSPDGGLRTTHYYVHTASK